jgi:hypothetical protein
MKEYNEIVINWKSFKSIDSLNENWAEKREIVYQIYCDSHIYGRDVLAYIGYTDNVFMKRYKKGFGNSFLKYANNVSFSIGEIKRSNVKVKIQTIESILIANHKPFFNKEYLHEVTPEAMEQKIIIINNGNHGSLKNSCTNYWWVNNK